MALGRGLECGAQERWASGDRCAVSQVCRRAGRLPVQGVPPSQLPYGHTPTLGAWEPQTYPAGWPRGLGCSGLAPSTGQVLLLRPQLTNPQALPACFVDGGVASLAPGLGWLLLQHRTG